METLNANCEDIRTQSNINSSNNNNNNIESELTNKNLSSHEGSPIIDRQNQMDTSVELNGSKNDGQQFCLRWNNHQVSVDFLFWSSIIDNLINQLGQFASTSNRKVKFISNSFHFLKDFFFRAASNCIHSDPDYEEFFFFLDFFFCSFDACYRISYRYWKVFLEMKSKKQLSSWSFLLTWTVGAFLQFLYVISLNWSFFKCYNLQSNLWIQTLSPIEF